MKQYANIRSEAKGFTLIELLVVIAIIGVLAAVVLLAINPAELLRRSRDSTRLQDMSNIRKALDAAVAQGIDISTACTATCDSSGGNRNSTGTGWIPLNVSAFLSTLPVDPRNAAGQTAATGAGATRTATALYYYYRAAADSSYELNTRLESTTNAARMNATGDAGSDPDVFETGTDPGLDLLDLDT